MCDSPLLSLSSSLPPSPWRSATATGVPSTSTDDAMRGQPDTGLFRGSATRLCTDEDGEEEEVKDGEEYPTVTMTVTAFLVAFAFTVTGPCGVPTAAETCACSAVVGERCGAARNVSYPGSSGRMPPTCCDSQWVTPSAQGWQ